MSRLCTFIGIFLLFIPIFGPAAGQQGPTLDIRLDPPGSINQEQQSGPQTPPLPPGSKASVAFEKIGDGREPDVKGPSAILVDADTGQILYSRKPDYRRPVASTTKIMTALLALEHCNLDGHITASTAASKVPHSSLNLRPGERLTIRDMLTGMMMRSANDAAHAFAEHISGSVSRFSQLMNKKASALGLKNTHFKNPHGLYVNGHYSTAYDLAVLAREAIKIETFNEIVAKRSATIRRSKNTKDVTLYARAPFMKYEGADGIKSGYTKQAGYCYVGSATRDGWRLICVILKSDNASRDAMALMDYGFNNFQRVMAARADREYPVKVAAGRKKLVTAVPDGQLNVTVAQDLRQNVTTSVVPEDLRAPVTKGQQVGMITALVDGVPVKSVRLVATEDLDRSYIAAAWLWCRWPIMAAPVLAVGFTTKRRFLRGRAPAKNTLRRRRRVAQTVRGTYFGR